jgi:hypothetical protein
MDSPNEPDNEWTAILWPVRQKLNCCREQLANSKRIMVFKRTEEMAGWLVALQQFSKLAGSNQNAQKLLHQNQLETMVTPGYCQILCNLVLSDTKADPLSTSRRTLITQSAGSAK